jgi:hypothetical protein
MATPIAVNVQQFGGHVNGVKTVARHGGSLAESNFPNYVYALIIRAHPAQAAATASRARLPPPTSVSDSGLPD